jgi:hypothetical protein
VQLKISRDGEDLDLAVHAEAGAVSEAVFRISEHYGSGSYEARDAETGEPVFRLTSEWLEGEEG